MSDDRSNDRRHILDRDRSISPPGAIKLNPDTKVSSTLSAIWGLVVLVAGGVAVGLIFYFTTVATKNDIAVVDAKAVAANAQAMAASAHAVSLSSKVDVLDQRTRHLARESDATTRDVEYIRARIDFLVEQTVIEARQSPAGRQRVRTSAARVQERQPAAGDALADLIEEGVPVP
jgi:hypothetical protein